MLDFYQNLNIHSGMISDIESDKTLTCGSSGMCDYWSLIIHYEIFVTMFYNVLHSSKNILLYDAACILLICLLQFFNKVQAFA